MPWDRTSVGRASGAGGMFIEVPPDREQDGRGDRYPSDWLHSGHHVACTPTRHRSDHAIPPARIGGLSLVRARECPRAAKAT
jgi:hypothetical protein